MFCFFITWFVLLWKWIHYILKDLLFLALKVDLQFQLNGLNFRYWRKTYFTKEKKTLSVKNSSVYLFLSSFSAQKIKTSNGNFGLCVCVSHLIRSRKIPSKYSQTSSLLWATLWVLIESTDWRIRNIYFLEKTVLASHQDSWSGPLRFLSACGCFTASCSTSVCYFISTSTDVKVFQWNVFRRVVEGKNPIYDPVTRKTHDDEDSVRRRLSEEAQEHMWNLKGL